MTYLGLGPGEGWAAFVVGLWPGRSGFSGHWLLSCVLWSGPGGHLRGYFCAVHSCQLLRLPGSALPGSGPVFCLLRVALRQSWRTKELSPYVPATV